jgi:hypothetical protein
MYNFTCSNCCTSHPIDIHITFFFSSEPEYYCVYFYNREWHLENHTEISLCLTLSRNLSDMHRGNSCFIIQFLSIFTALWTLAVFEVFLIYTQSVGLLGRGNSPSQGRCVHTEHKRTQTSMPRVGFEPTIPLYSWRRQFMRPQRSVIIQIKCRKTADNW